MSKLTAFKVKAAKAGRHADGGGLYLLVKDSGASSWMLRVQVDGRRRDIGLGSTADVTLAEAREAAETTRRQARQRLDPVAERKRLPKVVVTFEVAARECHESLRGGWKNKRHANSWLTCLVTYVFPHIGKTPVECVDAIMVRDTLALIWLSVPETARRIHQRISAVLDYSFVRGWRPTEASLRSVRKGLPRQPRRSNHFEAMPHENVPAFYRQLAAKSDTVGRDALRFTILTAARSVETRFASWDEIDFEKAVWFLVADRMKMNEPHSVPLAPEAIRILQRRLAARIDDSRLVFSSAGTKPISDMTMTKILRDSGIPTLTVHGFRSSFVDWVAETTSYPKEVADKALAHKLPDRVEAAYRRTDFFEKRRKLMDEWATFVADGFGA